MSMMQQAMIAGFSRHHPAAAGSRFDAGLTDRLALKRSSLAAESPLRRCHRA
jgi:hypothetical protein